MHNILVLHGSQKSLPTSPLRRTVYFEYRAIGQELKMGPHKPEYIPLKQRASIGSFLLSSHPPGVLQACLRERLPLPYDAEHGQHLPFEYEPAEPHRLPALQQNEVVPLRFPHKDFFRADYKG